MNRRTFFLALGATACGGRKVVERRPRKPTPRPAEPSGEAAQVANFYEAQTYRSPLAFRGDLLVQSAGNELWTWDTTTMKRLDGYVVPHRHFCVVQDGTLVVFALPPDSSHCVFHRIDARGIRETIPGPVFGSYNRYWTHVLSASSSDEVHVTRDEEILLFQRVQGRMEATAKISIPSPGSSIRGQLFSLGDGRLVFPGDGLHVLQAGKPALTYKMPERRPLHLVAATGERLWYSYPSTKQFQAANVLALARLETPTVDEHRVDFAPGRIVHLASSGRAVAALVFTMREGKSPVEPDLRWAVVVIDQDGTERWRAEVPASFIVDRFELNRVGFLAMSDHRVVLQGEKRALLAWDAASGAVIS